MFILALLGGLWFLFVGFSGRGKAYKTKMGTPLSEKEAKVVKLTYTVVGILLIIVAAVSSLQFFGLTK